MQEWYAVQTRPHKEFTVRDILARTQGVRPYLPIFRLEPANPRARKVRPFFPSYLFVYADLVQVGVSTILWNPGVVRVLGCGDQPVPIPEYVIETIRDRVERVQQEGTFAQSPFQQGDLVRIKAGPFEGFEGMFDVRLDGRARARIAIEFLGRLTTASIDIGKLELVCP